MALIQQQSPYSSLVKAQSRRYPSLQKLSSFLTDTVSQVSCRISCLEFHNTATASPPKQRSLDQSDLVPLLECQDRCDANLLGRLLIIEDLSREIIESLGSCLDIDPFFFASHLDTASRPNITTTRPSTFTLPSRNKGQNYVNLHYQHVVEFQGKTKQKHLFRKMNLARKAVVLKLQKLDLGISRHCCSILQTIGRDGRWIGVILLDPMTNLYTTEHGNNANTANLRSRPFHGGFESFISCKLPLHKELELSTDRSSLLEMLLSYWNNESLKSFNMKAPTLALLSLFPLRIIAGEFIIYLEIMHHSTKQYESSSKTGLAHISDLSADLSALQSWSRRSTATIKKVNYILRFLKLSDSKEDEHSEAIALLIEDYDYIAANLETYGGQLAAMLPIVASFIQIMDARRSFMEMENVTRLTYLALVFVPLTFTCGLFSMNDRLAPEGGMFGIYFSVAIPLCIAVFLTARPPASLVLMIKWLQGAKMAKKAFAKQVSGSLEV